MFRSKFAFFELFSEIQMQILLYGTDSDHSHISTCLLCPNLPRVCSIFECEETNIQESKSAQLTTRVLGVPFTSSVTSTMGFSNTPLSAVSHVDSAWTVQCAVVGFTSTRNAKVASEPSTLTVSGKTPTGWRAASTDAPTTHRSALLR